MDKQNGINENPNDSQQTPTQPQNDEVSLVDKLESKIFKEPKLENVRTQSIVGSMGEDAQAEYNRIQAQQAAYEHQQKVDEVVETTSRSAMYIVVCVLVLAIIGAGAWVAYNAFTLRHDPIVVDPGEDPQTGVDKNIGTYACKQADCEQVLELGGDRILIRDGGYVQYNTSTAESLLLSLTDREFTDISLVKYGEKEYLYPKIENEGAALFNLSDNLEIIDFKYEEFIFDTSDGSYKGMQNIESSYIMAKKGDQYYLVNIKSGDELAHGTLGVYATDRFIVSYDADGKRYVYNFSGKQITSVTNTGDSIYQVESEIFIVSGNSLKYFDEDGSTSSNPTVQKYTNNTAGTTAAKKLMADSAARRLPD